jgi:uncharacterized protein
VFLCIPLHTLLMLLLSIPVSRAQSITEFHLKKSNSPTFNHFYEKLLLLKDKMNTQTGKQIGLERHRFMENFIAQFYAEWDGEK